jgi:hypothetical protein
VLTELYQQMKAKPVQCDLAGLWNKLGIESLRGVSFNDGAPLAAVRGGVQSLPCLPDRHRAILRLTSQLAQAPRGARWMSRVR